MTLGERLKTLMALVPDLSLRELADLANISNGYPSLIQSGERKKIGADVAAKLAGVLGTTMDHLVSGTGNPPSARTVRAAVEAARARHAAETPPADPQEPTDNRKRTGTV